MTTTKYRLCSRDERQDTTGAADDDFNDDHQPKLTTPSTSKPPRRFAKPAIFQDTEETSKNQKLIVKALQSLKESPNRQLLNPWGLDFWDPRADNYFQSVKGLGRLSDNTDEQAWTTELSRYNLENLNKEYGTINKVDYPESDRKDYTEDDRRDYPGTEEDFLGTTRGDYSRTAISTSSPSPWEQLGW